MGWDSFKWRNHQPDIGRFFNIDPLAAKYVYNSPYAFSENRVVNGVELEGLEVVLINPDKPNNSKEQKEKDKVIKKGAEKIEHSESMVTVTSHGGTQGMTNDKTGEKIKGPKGLNAMLNKESKAWKNRDGNQGMTIVLYSCRTGSPPKDKQGNAQGKSFAEKISESKLFKDVEIIAPDQRVYFGEDGPSGTYKAEYGGKDDEYKEGAKNKNRSDEPGNWNVYKNGEIIRSYSGDWTPTNEPSIIDEVLYEN